MFVLSPDDVVSVDDEAPALSGDHLVSRSRVEYTMGQSKGSRDTIATIGVDYASDTDYFVYGHWLSVDPDSPVEVEAGAFSSALEFDATVPLSGSAEYVGKKQARGLHTVTYSGRAPNRRGSSAFPAEEGEFRIAHFVGDVHLTANFETRKIEGSIKNFNYPEPERSAEGPNPGTGGKRDFEVTLGGTDIDAFGFFVGNNVTTKTKAGWPSSRPAIVPLDSKNKGRWEGQFSSRPVSDIDSDPRAVAGTFLARFEFDDNTEDKAGTVGTYLGTFSAAHETSDAEPVN